MRHWLLPLKKTATLAVGWFSQKETIGLTSAKGVIVTIYWNGKQNFLIDNLKKGESIEAITGKENIMSEVFKSSFTLRMVHLREIIDFRCPLEKIG